MEKSYLKKLFLVDGIGAIISAFFLGIVLVQLEKYFGIPKTTLYVLAALPCFFAIYDFYCYFNVEQQLGKCLKGIAIVNLLYCCLSIGFAGYHYQEITYLGWGYIVGEIIIVVALAVYELRVANRYQQKLL